MTWWLWRGAYTRSHPELGRENPQRPWYCVLRHGRVGRRQVFQPIKTSLPPINAGWSSPVARQAHNLKAARSNRAPATKFGFVTHHIHKTVHASVGGFVVWGHGLMQRRDLLPVDVGEVGMQGRFCIRAVTRALSSSSRASSAIISSFSVRAGIPSVRARRPSAGFDPHQL